MAKNKKIIPENLIDVNSMSKRLSMSVGKIDKLIEHGDLQGVFKIGRKRFITDTDLQTFINEQIRKSGMIL